jgi:hypothetical protein
MSEDRLEIITVLDETAMVEVHILDGGLTDILFETAASHDEAEILILHEVPGALPLEGLRGFNGAKGDPGNTTASSWITSEW